MEILMATIVSFCQFSNPTISKENKEICLEKFVNCAIIKDGKTTTELITKCKVKIGVTK